MCQRATARVIIFSPAHCYTVKLFIVRRLRAKSSLCSLCLPLIHFWASVITSVFYTYLKKILVEYPKYTTHTINIHMSYRENADFSQIYRKNIIYFRVISSLEKNIKLSSKTLPQILQRRS